MNEYEKVIKTNLIAIIILSIINIFCLGRIIVQEKQIQTQAEYIEAQEWTEYIEEDSRLEAEYMNHVEEMRRENNV